MNYENHRQILNKNLDSLINYSEEIIHGRGDPRELNQRPKYFYNLFVMSLSFTKGVKTLIDNGQSYSAIIVLRSLMETKINSHFVYLGRSNVWFYHQLIKNEEDNFKKVSNSPFKYTISEIENLARSLTEWKDFVDKRYPELPTIPGLINNSNRTIHRKINLLEKCKIIDYYHKRSEEKIFENEYNTVYGTFSEIVHVTPKGASRIYVQDDTNIWLDIYGEIRKELVLILLYHTYIIHYDLLKMYHQKILNRKKLPQTIIASWKEVEKIGNQITIHLRESSLI